MWNMSFANFMMDLASIPDYSSEKKSDEENPSEDIGGNWEKYVSK